MDILKEKGRAILNDGAALIDTCGRTREIKEKSALALTSYKFSFTVIMLSSDKKKIFNKLEKKHGGERAKIIMHSVKLYYAMKDYIDTCPAFYICCEGFNPGLLKYYLQQLFKFKYHDGKINIVKSLKPMFGKKNIAHKLAKSIIREGKKPTLILKEKHFTILNLI